LWVSIELPQAGVAAEGGEYTISAGSSVAVGLEAGRNTSAEPPREDPSADLTERASSILHFIAESVKAESENARQGKPEAIAVLASGIAVVILAVVVLAYGVHKLRARRRRARNLAQWAEFDSQVFVLMSNSTVPVPSCPKV
jgi:hypothetical protein